MFSIFAVQKSKNMKKILLSIFAVFAIIFSINAQKLVILHTNDMHSKLTGFGPESKYSPMTTGNDETLGGFARMATVVKKEKVENKEAVILCDAGDFLMGTIFQSLEPETGFQLSLMKKIGYDVITLGNHEFDFGPQAIADVINSALKKGDIPQIVSSQLKFSEKEKEDDDLQKLSNDKVIKPYTVIEKNGLKIGFFGLLGEEAQMVSQSANPVKFKDIIKTSKEITKKLRKEEKVDIIICLSHSGVYPNDKGEMVGEDIKLAKKVPDIDIIISGHTHVKTNDYLQIGKTIIVQTGSYLTNLGRLEITYSDGKITVDDFSLIEMNDKIKGDKSISKSIDNYIENVDKKFFRPFGLSYNMSIAESDFEIKKGYYTEHKPTSLGNLITDAIKFYVNTYSEGTDIVMGAQGVIRESLMKGIVTPADIFRISPLGRGKNDLFGYPLAKVHVTGSELKKLMELAIFAAVPGEDSYLYFSGLTVDYNPKKGFLNKVVTVYVNGEEIDYSKKNGKLYSLTANKYLLGFVGEIKKMSKGLIKIYPRNEKGEIVTDVSNYLLDFDKKKDGIQEGKEWLAMIYFLKTFEDTDKDKIPNIPEKYKEFVSPFNVVGKK